MSIKFIEHARSDIGHNSVLRLWAVRIKLSSVAGRYDEGVAP
jgi:hypothetical protein